MKLFNVSIIGVLAAASGAFAQNVDWNAADTLSCGLQYFSDIKAAVDGNIQPVWDFLPGVVTKRAEEAGIVDANHALISNPTAEQLQSMATIFPSGLFSPYADNIVLQCLATYVPSETQPTDGETSDEPTSDEPTSDEPTSDETTDEETSGESTDEETSDEPTDEETSDVSTDEETSEETTDEESSVEDTSDEQTSDEGSTNEETSAEPTDEETTDETVEPTSSEPEYSAEPTSTPIKCRPRL